VGRRTLRLRSSGAVSELCSGSGRRLAHLAPGSSEAFRPPPPTQWKSMAPREKAGDRAEPRTPLPYHSPQSLLSTLGAKLTHPALQTTQAIAAAVGPSRQINGGPNLYRRPGMPWRPHTDPTEATSCEPPCGPGKFTEGAVLAVQFGPRGNQRTALYSDRRSPPPAPPCMGRAAELEARSTDSLRPPS